jgi:hypothetical protein
MRVLQLVLAAKLAQQSTTGKEEHKHVSDIEEKQALELVRYVTPYSTTLDVMKDVSHHGPALMEGKLRGYSFVDTWASQPGKVLWQNEAQTQCQAIQPVEAGSSSNGFMLHGELLYWPETDEKAGRVTKAVQTIQPSPFGDALNMGHPTIAVMKKQQETPSLLEVGEGTLMGHQLVHQTGTFLNLNEGEVAKVFACEEAGDIARSLRAHPQGASLLGLGDSFLQVAEKRTSTKGHQAWDLGGDHGVDFVSPRKVSARLDPNDLAGWHRGAQVYAKKLGPSDAESRPDELGNRTYQSKSWALPGSKHHPIGFVESMDFSNPKQPRALVQIAHGCPCEDQEVASAFRVAVSKTTRTPQPLKQLGVAVKNGDHLVLTSQLELDKHDALKNSRVSLLAPPSLIQTKESSLRLARPAENLRGNKTPGARNASLLEEAETPHEMSAEPVCVMREPTPTIGQSLVDFGEKKKESERWYAHVVGTGHGWENTEAKCGEFCKATYQLRVNGKDAGAPLQPWREDCDKNPNSDQMGTWPYPRNGWCPGAVANGHFVDVSSLVQEGGEHHVSLDLTHVDGQPVPYSNMRGFAFNDRAMFQTSMSFHKYEDGAAPASLLEDAVVRDTPSERPDPPFFQNNGKTGRGDNGPWHTYDKDVMQYDPPLYRVPIFSGSIHEMKTRLLTTPPIEGPAGIDKNVPWRIAMRVRLEAPPAPFRGDEWDRVASIGLLGQDQSA